MKEDQIKLQKTELEKYGHYLAYGVKIHSNTNIPKTELKTELEKYGHYLAYGVKI